MTELEELEYKRDRAYREYMWYEGQIHRMKQKPITPEEYLDGEPCSHPGCSRHVSHPCEVCGRIACRNIKITPEERAESLEQCRNIGRKVKKEAL